jgi:hypothetical protein
VKAALILISAFFIRCSLSAQEDKRIIFPSEKPLSVFSKTPQIERFTPTLAEIDSIDASLRRLFNGLAKKDRPYTLEDYYRQYTGYVEHGKRIIYVAGSCVRTPFFEEDMMAVSGNGNCFFEASVSLPSRRLNHFKFNGTNR